MKWRGGKARGGGEREERRGGEREERREGSEGEG